MPWPTITEFTDAVQNPHLCFQEPDLKDGQAATTPVGRTLVYSGNFASVYKLTTREGQSVAVRCFTREVKDQQSRYNQLSDYLQAVWPDSFVHFQYLPEGILVKGKRYPIVRMDWAEGETLNKFVETNLEKEPAVMDAALATVARRWRATVAGLRGLGIAHNDLQHGNVLVQGQQLRLVDYDGIFLPDFQGNASPETGHRNYQHPQREARHYYTGIDNFPALVVYLSLQALRADPALWRQFNDQDNLILTRQDYLEPDKSPCLQALQQNPDEQVRYLAAQLERYCSLDVEQTPDLESITNRTASSRSTPTRPAPVRPAAERAYPSSAGAAQISSGGRASRQPYQPRFDPAPASPPQNRGAAGTPPGPPAPSQSVAGVSGPAGAPSPNQIQCPRCGHRNARHLVYCSNPACVAELRPDTRTCSCALSGGSCQCRLAIPPNVGFCRHCGHPQSQPSPAVARPAAPEQTCPNCRTRAPATAKYCIRCGVAL